MNNKRPSERVNTLIGTILAYTLTQKDILAHLDTMRDQFQKEEAEAYKALQANNEYRGVHALLEKPFNKLTGRKDDEIK